MSSDTVVLEIAFVRLAGDALAGQEELWRQIDEQQLPPEVRRAMHDNGLRAGVVSSQLPPLLRKLLADKADPLAAAGAHGDVTASQRQLQSRAGKRGVILTGAKRDELTLLLSQGGVLTGAKFQDAQCLFAVKTFPKGDGRVSLELVPEVEHGQPKQKWVGQDGAFHVEAAKDHKVVDNLKMELTLSPGDVLVVTCSPARIGLGKQFFADGAADEQKVLLIRLAQTQYDDLFAPEKLPQPLVTPSGW
jgi:hypothetical protein